MTALHDFIQAAASYYGVPPERLTEGSTLDASRGDMELVLRVALTPEDVTSIAARMQRMALEREVDEAQAAEAQRRAAEAVPTDQQLRDAYNALSHIGRSKYGSFARFRAMNGGADPYSQAPTPGVLPTVELPTVELPPHVYLSPSEATEQQKALAVGRDARGWYAVDPADLTEQQQLRQRARQSGVTSNADDFGGLPG